MNHLNLANENNPEIPGTKADRIWLNEAPDESINYE
jgi:hypothetical protein